jgi:hypothetical protein
MRVHFRRLCAAALLVLALQPLYLLALMATDYIAPPHVRMARLQKLPPPLAGGDDTIECVSLAIGLEPGASALHNAIMAARPLGGMPCEALPKVIAKDPAVTWLPYPRYWHGYRVVIDPLTALFRLSAVRYLMLLAMIAALTWFAIELRFLVGYAATLAMIVPIAVLTDLWRNWAFTSQTLATVVIFTGAALAARQARRDDGNLILIAAVFGSLFNYVDFLVNVPWQPMLMAFVALAAGRRVPATLAIIVAWFGGYSLTWAAKWAIAVAAGASWNDIFDVILYRLNGDLEGAVVLRFLAPSARVFSYLLQQKEAVVTFLLLLPALLLPVRWPNPRRFVSLAWPALIPFVWFEILSNHTQIHDWMVYRPIASCIGIPIAAAIIASRDEPAGANATQQKSAG